MTFFRVSLLAVTISVGAMGAGALPHFSRLECDRDDVVAAGKDKVTFSFERDAAPENIYDLFEVPEINRKAYEHVLLSITVPTSECTMPQGFSLNLKCETKAMKVTLKASTDWDVVHGGKYNHEHELNVPVTLATSLKEKSKQGEKRRSVHFTAKLGETEWKSERDIFKIEMGKSNFCYVDNVFEIN